jgi:hypothetical protein
MNRKRREDKKLAAREEKKPALKPEKKSSLKEQIKAMENKKRNKAIPAVKASQKVSFDTWFHLRKMKIPKHHLKEIIWSYFKSRGLSKEETLERYDEEVKRYGIKI